MTTLSQDEVIARLRRIVNRYGQKKIAAEVLGVQASYLSEVLHGHKPPSPYLSALVGVRRRKVFIYTEARHE